MERRNNNKNSQHQHLYLKDLIDINEWQKIQDSFATITDVSLRTVDANGNALTHPSRVPRLCSELLRESPLRDKVCGNCLPTFLGGRGVVDKNLSFTCHTGLCNFVAPLSVDEKVFGYVVVGPLILIMRKSKKDYHLAAEELGLNVEEFWNAIFEVKVVSLQGARSLVQLIKDVLDYSLRLSYQNILYKKEVLMFADTPRFSKLLEALLDVAFQVTGADMGSIMLLDKDRSELTIHTSRGIADDIVKSARVKFGEGISGTAAKEERSFLLDENAGDNRIKPYLNRPYISSSMVVPIKTTQKVLGVMNLGSLKTSPVKFNNTNLQLIHKLINLTTMAFPEQPTLA